MYLEKMLRIIPEENIDEIYDITGNDIKSLLAIIDNISVINTVIYEECMFIFFCKNKFVHYFKILDSNDIFIISEEQHKELYSKNIK